MDRGVYWATFIKAAPDSPCTSQVIRGFTLDSSTLTHLLNSEQFELERFNLSTSLLLVPILPSHLQLCKTRAVLGSWCGRSYLYTVLVFPLVLCAYLAITFRAAESPVYRNTQSKPKCGNGQFSRLLIDICEFPLLGSAPVTFGSSWAGTRFCFVTNWCSGAVTTVSREVWRWEIVKL